MCLCLFEVHLFSCSRFNKLQPPLDRARNAVRDCADKVRLALSERGQVSPAITHGATKCQRAQGAGPHAEPMRTLLLRYHIAVCPVSGLNRT